MSKFKELFENLFLEYEADDPTDNFHLAAELAKQEKREKEKLYSKPIKPVQKTDYVYIKSISVQQFGLYQTNEMYLTNNKELPYTYNKEKAYRFPVYIAEKFIEKHPKQIVNKFGMNYEVHFELEKC